MKKADDEETDIVRDGEVVRVAFVLRDARPGGPVLTGRCLRDLDTGGLSVIDAAMADAITWEARKHELAVETYLRRRLHYELVER